MVSVIRVSYSDNDVSCTLYLGDETIISPVDRSPFDETKERGKSVHTKKSAHRQYLVRNRATLNDKRWENPMSTCYNVFPFRKVLFVK